MSAAHVHLIYGDSVDTILEDPGFLEEWRGLYDQCPHATCFQAPAFVRAWYRAYRDEWRPVVVHAREAKGGLVGLWLLAHDPATRVLAHAGTRQAEYHAWLARPGEDVPFLSAAWAELERRLPFAALSFKYLPASDLGERLERAVGSRAGVVVRPWRRPLRNLHHEDVKSALDKKRYKGRLSRLGKMGCFEFRRIREGMELNRIFDELIAFYDFRQGAVNRSAPFRDDPHKRRFHEDWFAADPEQAWVTATYLDERPIAAVWGAVTRRTMHLGMLMHSPFLSEYSPGKLHLLLSSRLLREEGKDVLDLTPGGDPWKEGFATGHDEVAEATVYRSSWMRAKARAGDALSQGARRAVSAVGLPPARVRSAVLTLRRARPAGVAHRLRTWLREDREFRLYRCERTLAERHSTDDRVHRNRLADLLLFEPAEPWQTRELFLSSALARLERGEAAYSIRIDGALAHSGWMVKNQAESYLTEVKQSTAFPPGSVALYDYYTHPSFRGRGLYRATIGHMLCDAFADEATRFAYIGVLADNVASRHVIEAIGFEYQRSFFWKRRLGRETVWTSPEPPAESSPEP